MTPLASAGRNCHRQSERKLTTAIDHDDITTNIASMRGDFWNSSKGVAV
jgi:hypothetical protein